MKTPPYAIAFKSFLYLFVFLMFVQQVTAEEWRGIVPLRSTRDDVTYHRHKNFGSHQELMNNRIAMKAASIPAAATIQD